MLVLLALSIAATDEPGTAAWTGGSGDWSDPNMWTGGRRPDSDSVSTVLLCASNSQVQIGLAGGRSQPSLVLCEGQTLDIAGSMTVALVVPAEMAPPSVPPLPPQLPPSFPFIEPNASSPGVELPPAAWAGMVFGYLFLCALIMLTTWRFCCRKRQRLHTQPQVHPTAEDAAPATNHWTPDPKDPRKSQEMSGFV